MEPQRVLMIGPSPDLMGGMSTVIRQMLAMDLADRFRIEFLPVTMNQLGAESTPAKVARHLAQRRKLGRLLRALRPSIVHFHTCSGASFRRSAWDMRVARHHGCRTVVHVHGAHFDDYYRQADWLEQRFITATLTSANRVIALSPGWGKKIQAMAPAARVAVLENAVELLATPPVRNARPECQFLTLARMDAWKGIDDLLDACALLKRWGVGFALTLAGPEGTAGDKTALQQKIRQRNLSANVSYFGAVHGSAKQRLLHNADVYVQPSHHEGMPLAILEAFAHALPVVATTVGAVPEIMEDDVHGLTVPPHQPLALARAMTRLAMDIPRRLEGGMAAFHLAKSRFSLPRFRADIMDMWERLVSERELAEPAKNPDPGVNKPPSLKARLFQQGRAA